MDDADVNPVTLRQYPQCGAVTDDGLIFCRDCRAALRPPLPLTRSVEMDGASSHAIGLARRTLIVVLKGIAGIAAIVAIICPLGSFTQILVFTASVAVALICYAGLTKMDATHIEEYGGDGYWPKPLDWNPPSKTDHDGGISKPEV